MFIGIRELERHPLHFREEFAPGTLDLRTTEFVQVAPLRVDLTAHLAGREIAIAGELATRVEVSCARCLEGVVIDVAPRFDLIYRPVSTVSQQEEIELAPEDTEIGFYRGDGLFLADLLAEQVLLALPMKTLCRETCRGLCPGCGVNLNRGRCHCGPRPIDPRLAPLAEWAASRKENH